MVSFGAHQDFINPQIQIRALNKTYQNAQGVTVHALKNVHLDIMQGEILGIIGKSGAGKSSLLRTINGLEQPSSGSIQVNQNNLTALDHPQLIQLRQNIGMIFQHFNLMSAKTVYENVALALRVSGYEKTKIEPRVNEILDLVGLAEKKQQYPSQLSGGQKQRVGIARALVAHPSILLCDEPTSALDPESTAAILKLLKKINQQLHISVVVITHEMQVIRDLCDRVIVIDHGEIVESGSVWSVFSRPKHSVTQELLHIKRPLLPFPVHTVAQPDSTHTLIHIKYESQVTQPPDLAGFFEQLQQPTLLYQSQTEQIQQHLIGSLTVAVPDIAINLKLVQQHLSSWVHQIEVIGYARPTH